MVDGPMQTRADATVTAEDRIKESIAQAQHDLRNPLGNILCFCEWLLPQLDGQTGVEDLCLGLKAIYRVAEQMVRDLNQVLDPDKVPAGPDAVKALRERLRPEAAQINRDIQTLRSRAGASTTASFCEDLSRMNDSAQRTATLIETTLSFYDC